MNPGDAGTATTRAAGRVVRVGLVVAFALMVVGLVVHVIDGGAAEAITFRGVLSSPEPGDRILMLGVLALALTPLVQILTLLVGWVRIRDLRYAGVAVAVVVVLTVGAFLGGA